MKKYNIDIMLQEIKEQLNALSEKQNSQYTDIMISIGKLEQEITQSVKEQHSDDELFREAKNLVIERQEASTSFLQRKLGTGYYRASKLIDRLEKEGVITKPRNKGSRDVLLKKV